MQQITLRIPEDVLNEVDAEADDRDVSRSEYVREMLSEGVSRGEYDELRREHEKLQSEHDELRKEHEREVERLRAEHDDLRDRLEEAEQDLERAENRADDLRRQLREANRANEDVQELVEYVEDERTAEQRRREAGIVTRAKWWLTGQPSTDEE